MALDVTLKRQLLEARANIQAQLEEIEFRSTAKSFRGGPPDFRDVYAELQGELREINELLKADDANEA